MVSESFRTEEVFDPVYRRDREIRKTYKRHLFNLGKESFVIGIVLIAIIFYFTFIFEIIPVIIVPFIAFVGLLLSIVQILRHTHAMALIGFILNLFVLIFSLGILVI